MNILNIKIDPRCMINYGAFYLYGMKKQGHKINFARIDGIDLQNLEDYRRGLALEVILQDGQIKKVYIDVNDRNDIHERFYEWADIYAKINLCPEDAKREKAFAIGPSFGIRLWNPIKTLLIALQNYLKWGSGGYKIPLKRYILDYLYTIVRRRPYKEYNCEYTEDSDYIFTLSTLWYSEGTYRTTNIYRGAFARACKRLFPKFEGGFYYIDGEIPLKENPLYHEYLEQYGDMIVHERMTMKTYIEKTKRSAFVFNTPSVVGCHGWKLAEYLAMGKAIISTPLTNMMPGIFEKNIHYIEAKNAEEITAAVKELREHPEKLRQLKENAKSYYNQYLTPTAVMNRILSRVSAKCKYQ